VDNPVISHSAFCLVHVPDLVCHGSKPRRELVKDPALADLFSSTLRSYDEAVRYPPNQTFIGNLSPEALSAVPRPWFAGIRSSAHSPASLFTRRRFTASGASRKTCWSFEPGMRFAGSCAGTTARKGAATRT
jgi:hypothetical protein